MKYLSIVLLLVAFALSSCANKTEYYSAVKSTNDAIVETVQQQASTNATLKIQEREAFSRSMTEASKTEDPTDNAVIAFAWGFATAQQPGITIPNLQHPKAPADGVDYLRAGLPYANLLFPWLMYGVSDSGSSGQRITADNGGTVILDSGNAGSYNQASKGATLSADNAMINDNSTNNHAGRDNNIGSAAGGSYVGAEGECPSGYTLRLSTGQCITLECEAIIDGGGSDSCAAGGVPPGGVGGQGTGGDFDLSACLTNPPAGFTSAGTPLYSSGVSCNSYANSLVSTQ